VIACVEDEISGLLKKLDEAALLYEITDLQEEGS
jgi:hypothetical protein